MASSRLFAASTMDWTLVPTPSVSLPTERLTQEPGASLDTVTETPVRRLAKVLVDEVAFWPPPRSSVASAAPMVSTTVEVPVESTTEKAPSFPEVALVSCSRYASLPTPTIDAVTPYLPALTLATAVLSESPAASVRGIPMALLFLSRNVIGDAGSALMSAVVELHVVVVIEVWVLARLRTAKRVAVPAMAVVPALAETLESLVEALRPPARLVEVRAAAAVCRAANRVLTAR